MVVVEISHLAILFYKEEIFNVFNRKNGQRALAFVSIETCRHADAPDRLLFQSVHDEKCFVHGPLRLNAMIEASDAAVKCILANTPTVRELVDNDWVNPHDLSGEELIREHYGVEGQLTSEGAMHIESFPPIGISDFAKKCQLT
jgi:Na+-translocating membrane potential-generating system (MpsB)